MVGAHRRASLASYSTTVAASMAAQCSLPLVRRRGALGRHPAGDRTRPGTSSGTRPRHARRLFRRAPRLSSWVTSNSFWDELREIEQGERASGRDCERTRLRADEVNRRLAAGSGRTLGLWTVHNVDTRRLRSEQLHCCDCAPRGSELVPGRDGCDMSARSSPPEMTARMSAAGRRRISHDRSHSLSRVERLVSCVVAGEGGDGSRGRRLSSGRPFPAVATSACSTASRAEDK